MIFKGAYLSDILNTLSIYRIFNLARVFLSYILSIIMKKPLMSGFPYAISFEPASICNLQCPECQCGSGKNKRKNQFMETTLFENLIHQNQRFLMYVLLYFQGEPFMNKSLENMIQTARNKRIYVCISTNGHFLTKERCRSIIKSGLHKLIISLDGFSKDSYTHYRHGGDIEKVKKGIENLVTIKKELKSKKPLVEIQTLVHKKNEHEIPDIKKWIQSMGSISWVPKSMQVNSANNLSTFLPKNPDYSRYLKNSNTLQLKRKYKNQCYKMWHSVVVTTDGIVLPCCYDKQMRWSQGSVNTHSLKNIWKSQSYSNFRKQVFINRNTMIPCNNCPQKF